MGMIVAGTVIATVLTNASVMLNSELVKTSW